LEEEWSKRAEQLMQDIGVRETNLTHNQETNDATYQHRMLKVTLYVKSTFIIHVGCTRCVTFSTDNILKIRARITLTVEFIRTRIF
jgi:hypothetical protein